LGKFHQEHIQYLNDSLDEIDYGTILITVHDGQITQIDATEKKRFNRTSKALQQRKTNKQKYIAD